MAEWGNPAGENLSSYTESIGVRSDTWGTEPSKYPEEKKSREIPASSGERTGKSLNQIQCQGAYRCWVGVEGCVRSDMQRLAKENGSW